MLAQVVFLASVTFLAVELYFNFFIYAFYILIVSQLEDFSGEYNLKDLNEEHNLWCCSHVGSCFYLLTYLESAAPSHSLRFRESGDLWAVDL